jgi:hypothetical protein
VPSAPVAVPTETELPVAEGDGLFVADPPELALLPHAATTEATATIAAMLPRRILVLLKLSNMM